MIELGRIYQENCIETLERMPDDLLDMTLTSPPYDDLREYNGYHFPFEEIARLLFQKTKPGGVVVWVIGDRTLNGNETLSSFRQAITFQESGFKVDCGKRYRQCFEYMFCFSKGQPKTFNPIMQPIKQEKAFKSFRITKVGRNDLAHDHVAPKERKVNNIFFYNVGTSSSKDKIAFEHPAIFPEQLAEDQISTWTNEGDLVYDCFMGSGTTAKAAGILGREWIGSEISAEYVKIAENRLGLKKTEIAGVK
jgi:site-specific DNA-methyltransferase (adenine-specific)